MSAMSELHAATTPATVVGEMRMADGTRVGFSIDLATRSCIQWGSDGSFAALEAMRDALVGVVSS